MLQATVLPKIINAIDPIIAFSHITRAAVIHKVAYKFLKSAELSEVVARRKQLRWSFFYSKFT